MDMKALMSRGLFQQEMPRGIKRWIQKRKVEKAVETNKALLIGLGSLAVVAGVATIVYFARRNKKRKEGQLPPRRAPQLNVDNPGTQNEFVAAPRESEVG